MRMAALTLVGAIGLVASAVAANAAPAIPGPISQHETNIVQVAGGCGWGFHPNRWGRCAPNRYSHARPYYRYGYARSYRYYGGGYYGPRSWSPSDNVANQLNRQELGRMYYGGGY